MSGQKPAIFVTQVTEWEHGTARRVDDYIAGEEPLEIHVNNSAFGVTLRTPGNDFELVAGLLFSEGVIEGRDQLISMGFRDDSEAGGAAAKGNVVLAQVAASARVPRREAVRKFTAGSACGVCGKAAIDELRNRGIRRPESESRFDPHVLCTLPEKLRSAQANFSRTGGLHAAALFNGQGDLIVLREDIGRHNAVDKVIGWAVQQDKTPLDGCILLASGRGGFEIVQKALVAGIPLLASVSAPSSLAVQLAREMGMTLIGFLRGQRFITYAGEERLALAAAISQTP
jgi:FdhD protein